MFLYSTTNVQAQSQAVPNQGQVEPTKEMTFTNVNEVVREVPKQKGRVAPAEVQVTAAQAAGQQATVTPTTATERHYLDNATRPDQPEDAPLILYNNTIKTPE